MITIDQQDQRVFVTVLGEFTVADFREFEEAVTYKMKFDGPISVMLDLREMVRATVDMAWEEIRFARQHPGDFRRVAVVSSSQWVAWSAWVSQAFVAADVQVFDDADEARGWLEEAD